MLKIEPKVILEKDFYSDNCLKMLGFAFLFSGITWPNEFQS